MLRSNNIIILSSCWFCSIPWRICLIAKSIVPVLFPVCPISVVSLWAWIFLNPEKCSTDCFFDSFALCNRFKVIIHSLIEYMQETDIVCSSLRVLFIVVKFVIFVKLGDSPPPSPNEGKRKSPAECRARGFRTRTGLDQTKVCTSDRSRHSGVPMHGYQLPP